MTTGQEGEKGVNIALEPHNNEYAVFGVRFRYGKGKPQFLRKPLTIIGAMSSSRQSDELLPEDETPPTLQPRGSSDSSIQ
ncbi:uncharacterized protein N7469_002815 [Penicillium citrinum]|uniref:Uncharacterized protein n=2 Tax=Penicillium TaxID=5073 RepID=A0A9W9TVQ0_PENCI|nr:uncharacterized protein N7469_002815 [Penicillium citrinum]KAJ5241224.1 hypothetical protein N7469_002815 [Penicillium citrinum]KAJ5586224.1 hypothetical protein N7450_006011 [Penicillium hetheringtonii]